ncbi:hypothetical protein WJX79_007451 [Trebouxia sp. C0005]
MGLIRSVINGTVQRGRNSSNEQGDDANNTHSRGPLPPGPLERRQMRMHWVEQKIAGSGKSKAPQQPQPQQHDDDGVGNHNVASHDTAVPHQANEPVNK